MTISVNLISAFIWMKSQNPHQTDDLSLKFIKMFSHTGAVRSLNFINLNFKSKMCLKYDVLINQKMYTNIYYGFTDRNLSRC